MNSLAVNLKRGMRAEDSTALLAGVSDVLMIPFFMKFQILFRCSCVITRRTLKLIIFNRMVGLLVNDQ